MQTADCAEIREVDKTNYSNLKIVYEDNPAPTNGFAETCDSYEKLIRNLSFTHQSFLIELPSFDINLLSFDNTLYLSSLLYKKNRILPTYYFDNKLDIESKFHEEYKKHNSYILTNHDIARASILSISSELAKLDYSKIAIELSPINAIKFKLLLREGKLLIVTKTFDNIENNQVVFSFFENRNCLISDLSSIDELVFAFNNYLSE